MVLAADRSGGPITRRILTSIGARADTPGTRAFFSLGRLSFVFDLPNRSDVLVVARRPSSRPQVLLVPLCSTNDLPATTWWQALRQAQPCEWWTPCKRETTTKNPETTLHTTPLRICSHPHDVHLHQPCVMQTSVLESLLLACFSGCTE